MGITRLTQDLSNYTELAVLCGRPVVEDGEISVSKVVIDGPSLVYHVYGGLLSRMTTTEITSGFVPTYSDVVAAMRVFLNDLRAREVKIEALLLDGDLPESKRSVRLERMETMRKQLEDFRTIRERLASTEDTFWDAPKRKISNARHVLPPLPFLVPAVVDAAKVSQDLGDVRIVSEEADVACARVAKTSGATIITNDSDLALYDLGYEGCVLILRTFATEEIKCSKEPTFTVGAEGNREHTKSKLVASSLRPARLAQKLGLPSLLHIGLERSMDSSVSFSTILQRAKDSLTDEKKSHKVEEFQAQFQISESPHTPGFSEILDPRTSEFVMQASNCDENPHVYLPMLHEDPSRDSSWSYGLRYRQLAYSIFYSSQCQRNLSLSHVIEHTRKGPRIAASSVPIWNSTAILTAAKAMPQDLPTLYSTVPDDQSNESNSLDFACVSEWHAAALCTILQRKVEAGKPPFSSRAVDRLFGNNEFAPSKELWKPMWEDMHLLANVHAVLYSWRMLKQIIDRTCEHFSARADEQQKDVSQQAKTLKEWLAGMPPVSDLFLNLWEMRTKGNAEGREKAANIVKKLLDEQLGGNDSGASKTEDGNEARRKKAKITSTSKRKQSMTWLNGNAFRVLANDTGEGDDNE